MSSSDIVLPQASGVSSISRSRLAAFVPIALALAGVAAILVGGISVRSSSAETAAAANIDPVVTGSITTPDDHRRALEMLDN
jgi:hypothetical protein